MALGLTQPLTEMSIRNISWGGKGGWYEELTTSPPSSADCLEIWEPEPSGDVSVLKKIQVSCNVMQSRLPDHEDEGSTKLTKDVTVLKSTRYNVPADSDLRQ
jgi:hypothetical protein